jgi:hypothetical protein
MCPAASSEIALIYAMAVSILQYPSRKWFKRGTEGAGGSNDRPYLTKVVLDHPCQKFNGCWNWDCYKRQFYGLMLKLEFENVTGTKKLSSNSSLGPAIDSKKVNTMILTRKKNPTNNQ